MQSACSAVSRPRAAPIHRLTACLVEQCANAGDIETRVGKLFAFGCEGAVATRALTLEQAASITAQTPCDDEQVTPELGSLIAAGARQIFLPALAQLCSVGPAIPDGQCEGLCENAPECSPPTSPLRDPDICFAACLPGSNAEAVGQTECASGAPTCDDFGRCYTGG